MKPIPDARVSPPDPQPWTEHECGCRAYGDGRWDLCVLHRPLTDEACAIIVRALFAVAGSVAAGKAPAEAVEDVRKRWGI